MRDEVVDMIKHRANDRFADIVNALAPDCRLERKRQGGDYWGFCPFHDDKHKGNFFLYEDKGYWFFKCHSCGASGDAIKFVRELRNLDYISALRLIADVLGIYIEEETNSLYKPKEVAKKAKSRPRAKTAEPQRHQKPEDEKYMFFPIEFVSQFSSFLKESNLIRLIAKKYGWECTQKALDYHLGVWDGLTMFPLIDKEGRCRDGEMIRYNEKAKRIRNHDDYAYDWVRAKVVRDIGGIDKEWEKSPPKCLFGEHLLTKYPKSKVILTEAPKTAIVGHCGCTDEESYVWVSCCGKENLKPDRLKALEGRDVILFPDAGCYDSWKAKVDEIVANGEIHFASIEVNDELEKMYRNGEVADGDDWADVWLGVPDFGANLPSYMREKTYGHWDVFAFGGKGGFVVDSDGFPVVCPY